LTRASVSLIPGTVTTPDNGRRDPLLSLRDAAEYCGLSYHYFARNYRAWHIPYIRIGRKVMFRRAHLDAFLKRHTKVSE